MSILVTGGAGYIGSHTVAELLERGEDIVVLDDLKKGHREAVLVDRFYLGNVADEELLERVFTENSIEGVLHFAANSVVPESVADPLSYYDTNVVAAHRLLSKMRDHHVGKIVFSSSAATYGHPAQIPLREDHPAHPINPYGDTKLAIERMLFWCSQAYGIRSISLRYFNAAGAHPTLDIGEDHGPESHLIPLVLKTALGMRDKVDIHGDDYATDDGTCIRDYVHVMDLAAAHCLALDRLRDGVATTICNLGSGAGWSVRQVVERARAVTRRAIPEVVAPRREGDPAVLIASSEKALRELGWQPTYDRLDEIIASAWRWHERHPHGFASTSS